MSPTHLDRHLDELSTGPLASFRNWPNPDVPPVSAGAYTIWLDDGLLYAGMAGRGLTQERIAHSLMLGSKPTGLVKRLASHASGRRSGDQFCIYVCDRFIVPDLSKAELLALREGDRILDRRTRSFIRERLAYRFKLTRDGAEALALEHEVCRGALQAGPPWLNPRQ